MAIIYNMIEVRIPVYTLVPGYIQVLVRVSRRVIMNAAEIYHSIADNTDVCRIIRDTWYLTAYNRYAVYQPGEPIYKHLTYKCQITINGRKFQ